MWYERCEHCGKIHTPQKGTAVYIGKRYFCKPSCSNAYRAKHSCPPTFARFEHG